MQFDQTLATGCAEIIRSLSSGELKPTINEPSTDTQVHVQVLPDYVLISFPGTASVQDWLTDLKVIKRRWFAGGRVHSGFAAAFDSVHGKVVEALYGNTKPVVICGHSLGGALALLTASALQSAQMYNIIGVYTFGQPRVGNGEFKRAYDAELNAVTFRVTNQDDGVPHVPPWLGGYRHAGREVYLRDDGRIEVGRSLFSQLQACAVAGLNAQQSKGASALVSLSAHHIASYIVKLKRGYLA